MLKKLLITICAVSALLPGSAMAKKFRLNDKSGNNSCKFVHDWFLHVKHKHAVFVTTDGLKYGVQGSKGSFCQAGGGDDLKGAANYAVTNCERLGKKQGNHARCKVVESR